jgi:zinc protease
MNSRTRLLALAALLSLAAVACTTPTPQGPPPEITPPPPAAQEPPRLPPVPQAVIDQSGVQSFSVDGLRVLLKQTPGKPIVSAQLYLPGGLLDDTPQTVGLENLALGVAAQGGTAQLDRDAFKTRLDSMGSAIGATSGRDAAVISMRSIKPYFNQTWELFAQVLTSPAFDEKQLELDRAHTIEGLRTREDSPDQYLSTLANETFFQGHPYAWQPEGTIDNVQSFTRQQLIDTYKALLTRERAFLIVVGDVDRPALEAAIKNQLAAIPSGAWEAPALPDHNPGPPEINIKARPELATNYVLGYFRAPAPDHPDYYPLLVAVNHLSDRLFEEVRTKRNLTYAVSAGIADRRDNVGYLYTTAVDPNTTIRVIFSEIQTLQREPLSKKAFDDLISVFLTEQLMREETNSAQATSLGNAQISSTGWQERLVFLDRVRAVTPEDILRVSQTWLRDLQWGYIGKPEAVDQALFTTQPADLPAEATKP